MGGLVHDYGYKYATLLHDDGTTMGYKTRHIGTESFETFALKLNVQVFKLSCLLDFLSLGFVA